jgi:hypothetical protein
MKRLMCIISIICISSLFFFIFTGCPSTGSNGGVTPSLVGTWVNSDYEADYPSTPTPKAVITDNGDGTYTEKIYATVAATVSDETFILTLSEEWTDSEGNRFLKVFEPINGMYALGKVHADNKTLEGNNNYVYYPTAIDQLDPSYSIHYRQ